MAEHEPRRIVEVYQNGNRAITTINDGCVFYEVSNQNWHSVVEIKRDLSGKQRRYAAQEQDRRAQQE